METDNNGLCGDEIIPIEKTCRKEEYDENCDSCKFYDDCFGPVENGNE